jgi:hypothetical protein
LRRFQEELQKRLRDLQEETLKVADAVNDLQSQRTELKAQAQNLGEAIAKMGHSATLLQQLAGIESRVEEIDERLALANQPLDLVFSVESFRDFVSEKMLDLRPAFDAEPEKAPHILANHIEKLASRRRRREMVLFMRFPGTSTYSGGPIGSRSCDQGRCESPVQGQKECNAGGGQRRICSALHSFVDPHWGACSPSRSLIS